MEGGYIGYWDRRTDSDLVYFSPRSLEIVGLDPTKNLLKLSEWRERIHPEDRKNLDRVGAEGIKARTTWNVEFRIRHSDGHWVWMAGSARVVEDDVVTGAPLRICGTHIDITARKTADLERENFFNFFRNSQDLMLIGDLEGRL